MTNASVVSSRRKESQSALSQVGLLYGLPFESSELQMPVATPQQQKRIMGCFFVVFATLSTFPIWLSLLTNFDSHTVSLVSVTVYVATCFFGSNLHRSIPNWYNLLTTGPSSTENSNNSSKQEVVVSCTKTCDDVSCTAGSKGGPILQGSDTEDTLGSSTDEDTIASEEDEGVQRSPKARSPTTMRRPLVVDDIDDSVSISSQESLVVTTTTAAENARHLVCIPTYLEGITVLRRGLNTINSQPQADHITVIVGCEDAAGYTKEERQILNQQIQQELPNCAAVHFYNHPKGLPGHKSGSGSNIHWALKSFSDDFPEDADPEDWIVTKVDAQVEVGHGYFTQLEQQIGAWKKTKTRRPTIWNPVILHSVNGDKALALTAAIQMIYSVSLFLNVSIRDFSYCCYSLPLTEMVRIGLTHPGLIVEDISAAWQVGREHPFACKIEPVPSCVNKAPPLGTTTREALYETYKQIHRFAGGGYEILPSHLVNCPSVGNIMTTSLGYIFRFWISSFMYVSGACLSLMTTSGAIDLHYKSIFTVCASLLALLFIAVMPLVEYSLIRRFGFSCPSPGQWARKILFALMGTALLGSIELYTFFQVVFYGNIGEYRPRKKF